VDPAAAKPYPVLTQTPHANYPHTMSRTPNLKTLALTASLAAALLPANAILAQGFGGAGGGRSSANLEQRQYRSNTLLGDAIIQTDPETRSLVIITDEATEMEISKIIKNLDRPKPQVLIKVLFLEVTHRKSLDVGVQGNYTYTHEGINSGSIGSALGLSDLTTGGFWSIASDDWEVTLKALAENGKLEVLSRPSILARNNQEAVIVVGQEIPLITDSRITDQNSTINTVQYSEIGIILRVTPFITSEGMVEMIVAPEISTLTDQTIPISVTENGSVGSPVIAKRSAETVVVTADGQTVVIGGLMENQKTEVVKKVPLLGDIPLLGAAFRRTTTEEEKKELLIFLTPEIVNNPKEMGALSKREAQSLQLAPKSFNQEKVSQFMDDLEWNEDDAASGENLDPVE
jgi:general secretion pathway protein D